MHSDCIPRRPCLPPPLVLTPADGHTSRQANDNHTAQHSLVWPCARSCTVPGASVDNRAAGATHHARCPVHAAGHGLAGSAHAVPERRRRWEVAGVGGHGARELRAPRDQRATRRVWAKAARRRGHRRHAAVDKDGAPAHPHANRGYPPTHTQAAHAAHGMRRYNATRRQTVPSQPTHTPWHGMACPSACRVRAQSVSRVCACATHMDCPFCMVL